MKPSQKGFTLVEVLVAVGLFAIALVGLTTLPIMVAHANSQARHVRAATNLARDKMEEIHSADYHAVASGSDPSPLTADGLPGVRGAVYTRSWTVDAGPSPVTKKVTVTVEWIDVTERHITLQSAVAG